MHSLPASLRTTSAGELKERVDAARRDTAFVLYRDGDGQQRIVMLDGPPRLTIGRQEASDVPLPWDAAVSRVHATLECVGEEWTLVDESSRNGSFVNGERIRGRRRLSDGDVIRIGFTTMAYVVPREREASSSTVAATSTDAPPLTLAQRRVLVALCRPLVEGGRFAHVATNQEIAGELILGVETVKTHMQALFDAFGLRDLPQNRKRAELARAALMRGAVTEDELVAATEPR